jgi:hypothetical protein
VLSRKREGFIVLQQEEGAVTGRGIASRAPGSKGDGEVVTESGFEDPLLVLNRGKNTTYIPELHHLPHALLSFKYTAFVTEIHPIPHNIPRYYLYLIFFWTST